MAGAMKFVNAMLDAKRVVLFTKKRLNACEEAKEIMKTFEIDPMEYAVVEIECRQDCTQIETYFQTLCLTNSREVPQLFIDKKHFGGIDQIRLGFDTQFLRQYLEIQEIIKYQKKTIVKELSSQDMTAKDSSLSAKSTSDPKLIAEDDSEDPTRAS